MQSRFFLATTIMDTPIKLQVQALQHLPSFLLNERQTSQNARAALFATVCTCHAPCADSTISATADAGLLLLVQASQSMLWTQAAQHSIFITCCWQDRLSCHLTATMSQPGPCRLYHFAMAVMGPQASGPKLHNITVEVCL